MPQDSLTITRPVETRNVWQTIVYSRQASLAMLFGFFWIVAAASFSGFITKWGLREGAPRFSAEAMLDGTAHKPFVYRQLVPMTANALDRALPEDLKGRLVRKLGPPALVDSTTSPVSPDLHFRYVVVYYCSFLALLCSLFVLREIVLASGAGKAAALVAPSSLALAFPYLQTAGGYFYDQVELLCFSLAFLLAMRGKILGLLVLAIPATLNKETFFFFLPTLYPLLRQHLSKRGSTMAIVAAVLVAGLINVGLKAFFADAPGRFAEFHLFHNLWSYLTPSSYFQSEITYSLIGPRGAALCTLFAMMMVVARGWPASTQVTRQHLLIAAVVNLPLLAVFAFPGELRNLSLFYVGFTILIAHALQLHIAGQPLSPQEARASAENSLS